MVKRIVFEFGPVLLLAAGLPLMFFEEWRAAADCYLLTVILLICRDRGR